MLPKKDTGSVLVGVMPHATGQLSPRAGTTKPVPWRPQPATAAAQAPRDRAPKQEKPPQREACAQPIETSHKATKTQHGQK